MKKIFESEHSSTFLLLKFDLHEKSTKFFNGMLLFMFLKWIFHINIKEFVRLFKIATEMKLK